MLKSIVFMGVFVILVRGDTTPLDTSCQTGQAEGKNGADVEYEIPDQVRNDPVRNLISNGVKDPWFSSDKFMHFGVSAAIPGLTYYMYVFRLNQDETQGKIISVSLTGLIGLGKEIYDKKTKGHFSWKDLVWDGLGLAAGYFIFVHEY